MNRKIVLAIVVGALAFTAWAATASRWVPVWVGTRYEWYRLGSTFAVRDGVLDVNAGQRVYGVLLTAPYELPAGATDVAVFLNGLRQAPGVYYRIDGGRIVPLYDWPRDSVVVVDYAIR